MTDGAWKLEDKIWVQQRKETWLEIKKNLEVVDRFNKTQLKIFESYYLKGKEPKFSDQDPICLAFRLWFYPDASEEAWNKIKSKVDSGDDDYVRWHYEDSLNFLFDLCNCSAFETDNTKVKGFMGGVEERLLRFFVGDVLDHQVIAAGNVEIRKDHGMTNGLHGAFMNATGRWLRYREPKYANPYLLMQYLVDDWLLVFTSGKVTVDEDRARGLEKYFKLILKFVGDETLDEPRRNFALRMKNIFDDEAIPENVKDWWEQVKSTGRIKKKRAKLP